MSATDELKGGHPPAVKVGGMRVVQHPYTHPDKQPKEEREKEEEEFSTEKNDGEGQVVAGVTTKGHKDFPAAAAKVAHEKPQPTKEKPPCKGPGGQPNIQLKQPSKLQ